MLLRFKKKKNIHHYMTNSICTTPRFAFQASCTTCIFFSARTLVSSFKLLPGATWAMDRLDVTALSLSDLFAWLHLVIGELQRRCVNFQSSSVPRPPPGPPVVSSSEEPQPRGRGHCGEQCKYCSLPCGRSKLGHSNHSCYQHRDRRD